MTEPDRPSLPLVTGLALVMLAGILLVWAQNEVWGQNPLTVGWDDMAISTDDAARIVQVRDLAEGQGWFDLRQTRLGVGEPTLMHWSRLVDAPMLLIVRAAELVTDPAQAERAAAALWPRILAFLWLVVTLGIAGQIGGRRGVWCAAFLLVPAALTETEFRPGRVDHHNLQLVLVLVTACAAIAARRRPLLAALAGGTTALSLSVGLETFPVVAAAGIVLALAWATGATPSARHAAVAYALGLVAGLPLAMAGTLAPMTLTTPLCDQLSPSTAVPIGLGCLTLVGLTGLLRRSGPAPRLAGLAVLTVAVATLAAWLSPQCLEGPYATIDPEVLAGMADIVERMSLFEAFEEAWAVALYKLVIWPVTGLIGLLAAMLTLPPGRRFGPAVLFGMALVATAVTWVELRGFRFALPLTFFGGVCVLVWVTRWRGLASAAKPVAVVVLLLAVTPLGWLLTPGFSAAADGDGTPKESLVVRLNNCVLDDEIAGLAALPPGRVLSSPNIGPYVLLKTPHHVLAAPYHRNIEGLRAGFRLVRATPDDVRELAAGIGADYLVFCVGGPRRETWSTSLLRKLEEGLVPSWLTPMPGGERLRVYRIENAPGTAAAG